MAAHDSRSLVLARTVATVGIGAASGLVLSIPAWILPALDAAPISPKDRLHLWSQIYDNGKATALTVFPTCAILFAVAAFKAEAPALYLPANIIARNRKLVLALCASLSASVVGFTGAFMMPAIKRMKKEESDLVAGSKPTFSSDEAIKKWGQQHLVRVAFATTTFALAVAELASS
ncbi:DUF1772 domain-containing protein [Sporobolomyces koalae]|uniref:DUF1772 domain-containing protein n=1 Tax=Sporobolomyces koalae TaxID=500713 RepID=UPI0031778D9F